MEIRPYNSNDYTGVKQLYEDGGWFDILVDSSEMLNKQTEKDPNSILVAVSGDKIIGTVSLLFTDRLALFFRLISPDEEVRKQLLQKGEEFFISKGYKRLDIIAPEQDIAKHEEYINAGFNKGDSYRWFWKERE